MTKENNTPQCGERSPLLTVRPINSNLYGHDLNHNCRSNKNDVNDNNTYYSNGTTNTATNHSSHRDHLLQQDALDHIYNKDDAIIDRGANRCYHFVPTLFLVFLAVAMLTIIIARCTLITSDGPTQTTMVSTTEDTNLDVYIPKTTNQNVLDYLDIPCLQAEIHYDKHNRSENHADCYDDENRNNEGCYNETTTSKKINNERQLKEQQPIRPKRCSTKCEATISLIRHCEKGAAREHCAYVGYERSLYLSTLFGNRTTDRWPVPAYIFALSPGGRNNEQVRNWREVETVMPLSHDNNLTIDYSFELEQREDLVKHIFGLLRSGVLCGKLVVVCWKHSDLPNLAESLGCGVKNGCPETWGQHNYDSLWEIIYSYHKLLNSPMVDEEQLAHKKKKKKKKKKKNKKNKKNKNKEKMKKHSDKDDSLYDSKQLWDKYPIWHVFGSAQSQGFDPLKFSKQLGDYQGDGNSGSWSKSLRQHKNIPPFAT